MEGIIIKNESNNYTVRTKNGVHICKPRGKFRFENVTPLVGDKVLIDTVNDYIIEQNLIKLPESSPLNLEEHNPIVIDDLKENNYEQER